MDVDLPSENNPDGIVVEPTHHEAIHQPDVTPASIEVDLTLETNSDSLPNVVSPMSLTPEQNSSLDVIGQPSLHEPIQQPDVSPTPHPLPHLPTHNARIERLALGVEYHFVSSYNTPTGRVVVILRAFNTLFKLTLPDWMPIPSNSHNAYLKRDPVTRLTRWYSS